MTRLVLFMIGVRQEDGREFVEGELAVGFRVIDFFKLAREFQRSVVRRGVMNVGQFAAQQLVDEVISAAANGSILVNRRAEAGSLLEFGVGPALLPFGGKGAQLLATFVA